LFSLNTSVSSTNKTDPHNIAKVSLIIVESSIPITLYNRVGTAYYPGELEIAPAFSGVLVYYFDQLDILLFLVTCCDVLHHFHV
jgi:hypothetical protein